MEKIKADLYSSLKFKIRAKLMLSHSFSAYTKNIQTFWHNIANGSVQIMTSLILLLYPGVSNLKAQSETGKQAKIQSAQSAAPYSVSADATVVDWDGIVLQKGSNGWRCYPNMPDLPAENPMCLDKQWINWWQAYMNNETPYVTEVGTSYMLKGGAPNSNTDPYAKVQTPDNQWMSEVGPHIMIILPNPELYKGLSTDPNNGGPWVMFPGTPYAHIMVPAAKR